MTQDYDIEYEVTYSDSSKLEQIEQVLKNHSWDAGRDISHYGLVKEVRVNGYQDLLRGDELEEAVKEEHEEITKEILAIDPKAKVITRWHYCTGWEWDYEYGEEEEGPPSDDARQTAGSVPA